MASILYSAIVIIIIRCLLRCPTMRSKPSKPWPEAFEFGANWTPLITESWPFVRIQRIWILLQSWSVTVPDHVLCQKGGPGGQRNFAEFWILDAKLVRKGEVDGACKQSLLRSKRIWKGFLPKPFRFCIQNEVVYEKRRVHFQKLVSKPGLRHILRGQNSLRKIFGKEWNKDHQRWIQHDLWSGITYTIVIFVAVVFLAETVTIFELKKINHSLEKIQEKMEMNTITYVVHCHIVAVGKTFIQWSTVSDVTCFHIRIISPKHASFPIIANFGYSVVFHTWTLSSIATFLTSQCIIDAKE